MLPLRNHYRWRASFVICFSLIQIAVVYKQCKGAASRWAHTRTGHLRSSARPLHNLTRGVEMNVLALMVTRMEPTWIAVTVSKKFGLLRTVSMLAHLIRFFPALTGSLSLVQHTVRILSFTPVSFRTGREHY